MQLLRSLTTNSSETDPAILDEMDEGSDQLFFVTSYSDFEKLGEFFVFLICLAVWAAFSPVVFC